MFMGVLYCNNAAELMDALKQFTTEAGIDPHTVYVHTASVSKPRDTADKLAVKMFENELTDKSKVYDLYIDPIQ